MVIAYVTYLCHHLLVLRNETRAAIFIQRVWRKRKAQQSAQTLAVSIILRTTAAILFYLQYMYVDTVYYICMYVCVPH